VSELKNVQKIQAEIMKLRKMEWEDEADALMKRLEFLLLIF
jgi:hypothetical protein